MRALVSASEAHERARVNGWMRASAHLHLCAGVRCFMVGIPTVSSARTRVRVRARMRVCGLCSARARVRARVRARSHTCVLVLSCAYAIDCVQTSTTAQIRACCGRVETSLNFHSLHSFAALPIPKFLSISAILPLPPSVYPSHMLVLGTCAIILAMVRPRRRACVRACACALTQGCARMRVCECASPASTSEDQTDRRLHAVRRPPPRCSSI
eukprot:382698-Pleurochrysis_carterae.AAC.1